MGRDRQKRPRLACTRPKWPESTALSAALSSKATESAEITIANYCQNPRRFVPPRAPRRTRDVFIRLWRWCFSSRILRDFSWLTKLRETARCHFQLPPPPPFRLLNINTLHNEVAGLLPIIAKILHRAANRGIGIRVSTSRSA